MIDTIYYREVYLGCLGFNHSTHSNKATAIEHTIVTTIVITMGTIVINPSTTQYVTGIFKSRSKLFYTNKDAHLTKLEE